MLNKYLAMKKFLDAEMLKIKADLKPQVKVEVSNFVDTIFKEFDKLGAMSALYVDMAGLLKFIEELKPESDLEQELMDLEEESYTPKEALEINEQYLQMVWDMESEDAYRQLSRLEGSFDDDYDEPFIDSAGFDSNGINHFQEKLNQHPDDDIDDYLSVDDWI